MKKVLILLIMILFFCSQLYAQKLTVKGKVLDAETKDLVRYATVAFYDENDVLIEGTMSSELGEFTIAVGKFEYLAVSFIGYEEMKIFYSDIRNGQDIQVLLKPFADTLDEVVIEAKASQKKVSIDRKTYTLGSDAQQAGANAFEAFEQFPEVQVDHSTGVVSLRGDENVRVLINGKPSPLSTQEVLQQIQSSNIDYVEIITAPSARYTADGLAGIINVVLKKQQEGGLNLSMTPSIGTRRYGVGINGNYSFSKYNIRFSGSQTNQAYTNHQSISRLFGDASTERVITPYEFDGQVNKITTGFDMFISEKQAISVDFSYTDDTHSYENPSSFSGSDTTDYEYLRNMDHFHEITNLGFNYRIDFNQKKQFLELDYYLSLSDNTYPIRDFIDQSLYLTRDLTEDFQIESFAIDYHYPISDAGMLELGGSRITQELQSSLSQQLEEDFDTLSFDYEESLLGAYASLALNFEKIKILAGLRYEYFESNALTSTNLGSDWEYGNLFPSFHLSYKLDKFNSFNVGYSKRISRPNFHHINAYQIVNPVFEWEYNPSIAPEFSHNVELDYLKNYKKASFRLGVFYRYKTDLILWTQRAENNIQVFRYENADNEHSYGAEADLSVDLFDWLSTSATANFYYSSIQSDLVTWDRIYSSRLKVKSQFKITKFLSSDITYNYLPQQQRAFSFIKSRSRVDWAFNSSLFGGKVNANLRIIDLFNTNIIDRRSEAIDLEQETSWDIQNLRRSYVLSLAYTPFSKSDFKRTKKRRRRQEVPVD